MDVFIVFFVLTPCIASTYFLYIHCTKTKIAKYLRTHVPCFRSRYEKEIKKMYSTFLIKNHQLDKNFKDKLCNYSIDRLPEEPWSSKKILEFLIKLDELARDHLGNTILSGCIYRPMNEMRISKFLPLVSSSNNIHEQINNMTTVAYSICQLWNSLHSSEFPLISYLERNVISMCSSMFSNEIDFESNKNNLTGFVTSGGTESIMIAMRIYRNIGYEKGINNPVIIAPDTVHASIHKASIAYRFELILIQTNKFGSFRISDLLCELSKYEKRVVAIVGSGPSYSTGIIDPIEQLGEIAIKNKIGFHVDCCLGAFVVNINKNKFLSYPGVTSLSMDPHKFGLAPKGASVLILGNLENVNLMYYSIYTVPDWTGGIYGSPRDPGSTPSYPLVSTLVTMLCMGNNGYMDSYKLIVTAKRCLINLLKGNTRITIYESDNIEQYAENIICFSYSCGKFGATYVLAKMMEKNGVILNALSNDRVHFCITPAFTENLNLNLSIFESALTLGMNKVRSIIENGEKFDGNAKIYGTLESTSKVSLNKFGDYLFGKEIIENGIRSHFLSLANPNRMLF